MDSSGLAARSCEIVKLLKTFGVPYEIRTRVTAVKGRCPRPLDERDDCEDGSLGNGRGYVTVGKRPCQTPISPGWWSKSVTPQKNISLFPGPAGNRYLQKQNQENDLLHRSGTSRSSGVRVPL